MRRLWFIALVACSRTALDAPVGSPDTVDGLRATAPLSTSTVTTQSPTFHWTGGHGAVVEVCARRACDAIEASVTSPTTSATLAALLAPGVHYFRLRPLVNGAPATETTPVWEFRVPHRSAPRDVSWGDFPDFDGDGFADLIVHPVVAFATEIYPGSARGVSDATRLEVVVPQPDIVDAPVPIGDVNGDGFVDLAIGRSQVGSTPGVVYLYFGGPNGIDASQPSLAIDPPSDAGSSDFGRWVSSGGNLDGDGYADFLVGSLHAGGVGDPGRVYVYFGGPGGPATTPATTLHGDANDDFGVDFAEAGDFDGDGFPDVVLVSSTFQSAPHGTVVYLYRGSATGPSDATRTVLMTPPEGTCARVSPTPADFDGDGLPDVAVGVDGCNAPIGAGTITVFYGGGTRQTTVAPPPNFEGFGYVHKSGGDVNGDGYDNLAASMEIADVDTGAAIFWGSPVGLTQADETTFAVVTNPDKRSAFGLAVSDLDGDGRDDVSVAPIDATPITVFSASSGTLTAGPAVTPPGAGPFYEPVLR